MAIVAKLDAAETETIFNNLVDKGVYNLKEMEEDVLNRAHPTEIDLLVNFKDLIYHCIDTKKNSIHPQHPVAQ